MNNNYPYYDQQTYSLPQTQQTLSQPPVHPVLPALAAAMVPNNFRNYVHPVTAIHPVSAEAPDSSLQVQAQDEEIALLHTQL